MILFEIVFSGEVIAGAQVDLVKANMARLFQADEQRMATLFSGRRLVLKSNLDAEAAERYRATLERAGAKVAIGPVGEPHGITAPAAVPAAPRQVTVPEEAPQEVEEIMMAPPPDQPGFMHRDEVAKAPPARARVEPRDVYMAAFTGVDAPDFAIAEVGADLADKAPRVRPPRLDLDQFSLAPAGADMGQALRPKSGPVPDTSHLKIIG